MESRIPLPTDNIYKFYALFGLLLFIFGFSAVIYLTKSTNDFMAVAVVDLEELKAVSAPSAREAAKKAILTRQIEVAKSDRQGLGYWSEGVAVFGSLLMMLGFSKWHGVVQPRQDEMAELQLTKLRYEVQQLKSGSVRRFQTYGHPK